MQNGAENGSAAFRGRALLRSCRGSSFKDCPLRRLCCRRCLRLAVHRERCRRVRFARQRDQADILAPALAEPPARIRTVSPGTGAAPLPQWALRTQTAHGPPFDHTLPRLFKAVAGPQCALAHGPLCSTRHAPRPSRTHAQTVCLGLCGGLPSGLPACSPCL